MRYFVTAERCYLWQDEGWRCTRHAQHSGPCALQPVWWMKVLLFLRGKAY